MKRHSVSRRRVLAGASASAAALAPVTATALGGPPGQSDPIFAAIKAFEAARDALNNHPSLEMEHLSVEASWEALEPAEDAYFGAQRDLLTTRPTTVDGLLTFIEFLIDQEEGETCHFPDLPEWWAPIALNTIAASIRAMQARMSSHEPQGRPAGRLMV
jgi:hypothetical protein